MCLLLRVGARASELSKKQVEEVYQELIQHHPHVSFDPIYIDTMGDLNKSVSLRDKDKSDFFTKEIDELLLHSGCDVAIHSAKDVPQPLREGLSVIAYTKGVDPADVLVLREEGAVRRGARIGTSSLRREKALQQQFPESTCVDIRGTIHERLHLLDAGAVDGVVMAKAALIRLNLLGRPFLPLEGEPAPLQGQLAVVARSADEELAKLFACIHIGKR